MADEKFSNDELKKAIEDGLSLRKMAEKFGVNPRTITRRKCALARKGWSPDHDMTHTVPDGYHVKGASTLYDESGKPKLQWVKSSIDRERQEEMQREAIEAMADELPRLRARKARKAKYRKDLMACYPIGDAHIGMRSWPKETGESWDLAEAERIQCGAMAELVERSPVTEKATIVNLGDWYHFDNMEGVTTRSGHSLDCDGRYAKMVRVGVKVIRQCIESALEKHKSVHVINVVGNHDDTGAMFLSVCLANVYEKEKRVTIDTSPSAFQYFRFGRTLVGTHHGHSCKAASLPGVMATDRAEDWGQTTYRYWWIGHVHHQSLKDYPGVTVESFRTLAAKDAYAHWGGYRAPRDMKCIVLHEEYGEVARHTVTPGMVE